MKQFRQIMAVTAGLVMVMATPSFAKDSTSRGGQKDIFAQIVNSTNGLEKVYDNGDDCQFIITTPEAQETLFETISEMASAYPTERGNMLTWRIDNRGHRNRQAKVVSVIILDDKTGRAVMTLDRRKGEQGRNPNADERKRARSRTVTPPPPPPPASSGGRAVPPPASVD